MLKMAALFLQTRWHSLLHITEVLPQSLHHLRLNSIDSFRNTQLELIHCVWEIDALWRLFSPNFYWIVVARHYTKVNENNARRSMQLVLKKIHRVCLNCSCLQNQKKAAVCVRTGGDDNDNAVLSSVLFWNVSVLFFNIYEPPLQT